jgi:hypothetical protein
MIEVVEACMMENIAYEVQVDEELLQLTRGHD